MENCPIKGKMVNCRSYSVSKWYQLVSRQSDKSRDRDGTCPVRLIKA